ncbi:MAG: hypothetical protein R3D58_09510 [Saprospiraceae bacterium]
MAAVCIKEQIPNRITHRTGEGNKATFKLSWGENRITIGEIYFGCFYQWVIAFLAVYPGVIVFLGRKKGWSSCKEQ